MSDAHARVHFRFLTEQAPVETAESGVLAPARWRFRGDETTIELGVLMPNVSVNGALLEALERTDGFPSSTVGAILAADPFAIWDDLCATLRDKGIGRVINYPTMGAHSGPLAEGLHAMGTGYAAEIARLDRLQGDGLGVVAMASSLDQVVHAAAIEPESIVLHAFAAQGSLKDADLITEARQISGRPIVLHGRKWHGDAMRIADGALC
ncbi:MAG: hypothetical protein RIE24_08520 [Silicimonas sp.]|jgi:predicted TIM-barrel enzyme|uniref:hypothetical protein n=1 Tax=Roseitalea porphyridii TaxID=1852022 RepID=UPI0032EE654F